MNPSLSGDRRCDNSDNQYHCSDLLGIQPQQLEDTHGTHVTHQQTDDATAACGTSFYVDLTTVEQDQASAEAQQGQVVTGKTAPGVGEEIPEEHQKVAKFRAYKETIRNIFKRKASHTPASHQIVRGEKFFKENPPTEEKLRTPLTVAKEQSVGEENIWSTLLDSLRDVWDLENADGLDLDQLVGMIHDLLRVSVPTAFEDMAQDIVVESVATIIETFIETAPKGTPYVFDPPGPPPKKQNMGRDA